MNGLTKAAQDVLAERARQISAGGWTPEHDDEHDRGEMARAAGCYAIVAGSCQGWPADTYKGVRAPASVEDSHDEESETFWPWDKEHWKPKDPRRDMVRAAALLLAEIERLDRASGVPAVQPWEVKVRCSKGERVLRAGMQWTDSLHGGTWEVIEPNGKRAYSPNGLGGTPDFWCKHVNGPNNYRAYARDDGCVEFCGDSIAAQLVTDGVMASDGRKAE